MRFRFFLALLLVISVAMITGCGGGGGGDTGSSATTITTRLVAPTASGNGSLRGSVKAAYTDTLITGATVTLVMADGTTYTMRDNGNGEYSATVTEIPGAGGFYIEAHKGDLELQNLFTSLPTDLNAITTDYLSTTFTQVALAFAQSADYGGNAQFASATTLLNNVTNVKIEFDQLRTEVTDEENTKYTQTRSFFQAALATADTAAGAPTETILDKLAEGTLTPEVGEDTLSWTDAITAPLASGTFLPPVIAPADDETAIKAAAQIMLNAIAKFYSKTQLSQHEIASISGVLSNGFIHQGMTKSILLSQLSQGLSEKEGFVLDHFEGDMVLRKINDTTYLVGPVGTVYEKDRDGNIVSRPEDSFKFGYDLTQRKTPSDVFPTIYRANGISPDSMFPLLIRQEDGGWKILGNGIKVSDIWMHLTNHYEANGANSGSHSMFWLEVKDTEAFSVKSVTFSGTQAPTAISLSKNEELADSNSWHYWWTDPFSHNTFTSGYPNPGWAPSVVHKNGDKYQFVVTFEDDSTQTFEHTITNLPSNWTYLNAGVTAGSTGVTATWTVHPWDNFDQYYISIHNMNTQGDSRILEKEIGEKTQTSFTFAYQSGTAYTLAPGSQIGISIQSENRWGFSSSYWAPITIPQY